METSVGHIKFKTIPTKLAKSAVVVVGVKFPSGCYFTLQGLKHGSWKCGEQPYSSAFLYGVYQYVHAKLFATYADELNSQISGLDCNYQNGEFTLTAKCTGTVSGIRRVIAGVLKTLVPRLSYPIYKDAIKNLEEHCSVKLTTDKKHFVYLAEQMTKALKSNIVILIGGRAMFSKDQFTKMTEAVSKKLNLGEVKGEKQNPNEKNVCIGNKLLAAPGLNGVLAKRYIESVLGIQVYLVNGNIYGPERYKAALKKLNDDSRVTRHVGSKYKKYKDDLSAALIYLAMANNLLDTADLIKCSKSNVTGSSIVANIKSALK